jgi:hypothetical protein
MMIRKIYIPFIVVLLVIVFTGCKAPADNVNALTVQKKPFSPAALPAKGYIEIGPVNTPELERLGLEGPAPMLNPPYQPYNEHGLYWSQPFNVKEGDVLQVKVYGDTPISWFGVDWQELNLRGIVATTELDEDGRTFDPQYPADSTAEQVAGGYALTMTYNFTKDRQCVLVVKNASVDKWKLSVDLNARASFSLTRWLKSVPLVKNLFKDKDDEEYD